MLFISMNNVSKTFNGIKALNNIDLSLNYGEAICLAGQNGCGKSTLIKILSGVYHPDPGANIRIGAKSYSKLNPRESIEKGIQVIYQDLALFPNLTVAENIAMNSYRKLGIVNQKNIKDIAKKVIKDINAKLDLDVLVEDLPIAQQQLVAICRALAQNAKLLIMDEPTASLTDKEVKGLLNVVFNLKGKGISIIFVSHKLNEVMSVSDNVVILKDGNIIGKYPISEMNESRLAYLMTGIEFNFKKLNKFNGINKDIVLETENLTLKGKYNNINFHLRKGEIISIIGLLGSGRTELCLSLFGILPPNSGKIFIDRKYVNFKNNRDAIKKGIAYVSEDRMNTGLIMSESIHNNIISTIFNKVRNSIGFINNDRAYQYSNDLVNSLNIKLSDINDFVNTLSGGNAQRVSIAKWLAISPKIMILDSPTIGVDVANKEGIFNIIKSLAEQGISIIFVTDEVSEAYFNSHRILVMKKGEIIKEFIPDSTLEEDIYKVIYESDE